MIGEYTLKILCDKYNISSDKIVNKNNNILTQGEYVDIDKTLNYLINKLNISASNIEKCPSILYKNVAKIEKNVSFLKQQKISFSSIENCLHVLSTNSEDLIETYKYIEENYGVLALNKNTSALSCNKELIIEVEKLNLNKDWNLTIANSIEFGYTTIENVKAMINSAEYKEYPELFTSTTLAKSDIEKIQAIINSEEFKEHRELFTSTTLAQSNVEKIREMLNSEEFKEYPKLFTSETLAKSNVGKIREMLNSEEFKKYPKLFTSQTLAKSNVGKIRKMLNSEEFKKYPKLFTSTTLGQSNVEKIREMLNSEEFKKYPKLFTSETLAKSNVEKIREMLNSEEFKEHPELFTSSTLAHSNIEKIQAIINSDEFKKYPELFTSQVLARAKIEDISELLKMPYWSDERYKNLLTSTIVARSKQMLKKLPILFEMAEEYQIENNINTSFLTLSPSQNYALINYLLDNNLPLVIDNKLNTIFGKQPIVLKKKYGIDIKELMKKYPYENNIGGIKRNGIR